MGYCHGSILVTQKWLGNFPNKHFSIDKLNEKLQQVSGSVFYNIFIDEL